MAALSLKLAARELRSGVRGFRIFLACLALGVAAIAAAGSTAEAFRQGLASQAREILGGDLSFGVDNRDFSPAERAAFDTLGVTTYTAAARAMAQASSGERRLISLRGVDTRFPLAGTVKLDGAASVAAALADHDGVAGAAVEPALLDRLHLKLGDRFQAGPITLTARAVLVSEPDGLSRGFALGPRVMVRGEVLERSGLLAPGGLSTRTVRIALPAGQDPRALGKATIARFPDAGLQARDRLDAAPGARRLIDQLEYFLGFIGLASLVAGGLGVAGAVSAYLATREPSIAVLKALGADGALIRNLYLVQIGLLATLGVAIGLVVGAVAPLILGQLAGSSLPIPALFAVYPWPLAKAGLFGLLAAAAFSLVPLARARRTPPSALFRRSLGGRIPLGLETLGAVLAGAGLAALAVVTAPTPLAAGIMIAGVAVSFGLLWALGLFAAWGAGRVRRLASGPAKLGLANLAGPRSAARTASPAIGLGVALLACVVLIQSALLAQVTSVAPRTAPAMVFTEIPGDQAAAFDAEVARAMGPPTPQTYLRMPFATGRISGLKGKPVDLDAIKPGQRWAFDNDIGLSLLAGEPTDGGLVAGQWWKPGYAGPPLLAINTEIADAAGLKIGDTVTLSILGRDIDARIAVLRKIEFGGFGPNFNLILDTKALEGAALRSVAIARLDKAREATLTRRLGASFPGVNVISVREQLDAAAALFDRLALAVRGAAAVAGLAGLLVLAGAIAAGARARAREAATLKVLGATRGQILAAYAIEYGAVGLIAGTAGVALGFAAAWPVVVKVFEASWSVDWGGVMALLAGAAGLSTAGGLLAAALALAQRPAPVLRAE
ncbi:putative ABC-type transport system involved in lysophospholipase L1 biosynthesis, permease component [Caulobacter sp. AP07]|uniref:ABC transporter permease n=1 Tax=Caulobacter sp. AP07 TaxID=1144304 RepID=UPI000271E850|nr:putative ABC-type transport system involved in lysophospholipase L1 biosynthesis, permease component [Caulobacter sp. AP07]